MTIERRRIWASRILLAVMVMMTMATALHRHPEAVGGDTECEECLAHRPHAPHLSNGTLALDDCLICQLAATTFVVATVIGITKPHCRTQLLTFGLVPAWQSVVGRHSHSRAPPTL